MLIKKNHRIRLLVFDLDNTALGGYTPYHRFPGRFVCFLNELKHLNIQWATCTTWGVDLQFSMVQYSGVKNPPVFLSGSSGLDLMKVINWKLEPDAEHARRIKRLSENMRKRNWPVIKTIISELLKKDWICEFEFNFQNILSLRARSDRIKSVRDYVNGKIDGKQYYEFDPNNKSFAILLPFYMNKGMAVETMQRRLGIGPDETLVAGDGCNDLSMMALAKWVVCPANAAEEVKKAVSAAGGIIGSRKYSDGVVEAIRKLMKFRKRKTFNAQHSTSNVQGLR